MLKGLQNRYLKKNLLTSLEERDNSQVNNKARTLGFLVDEDFYNNFERLYEIPQKMGLQHKDIKLFTFVNVKKKTPSLRQNQINNKEFSWKGIIQNQNANEFLEIPFDVLIAYYKDDNSFLNLMVAKSKAAFKVGFKGVNNQLFDLIIDVDPLQVRNFETELIKYMKVLNKINS